MLSEETNMEESKQREAAQEEFQETLRAAHAKAQALTVAAASEDGDPLVGSMANRVARELTATLVQIAHRKQSVEETMARLEREIEKAKQQRQWRLFGGVALFVMLLVLLKGEMVKLWWLFITIFGAGAAEAAVSTRREAAAALKTAGDPRAVGVLAVALQDGDAMVQRVAREALQSLLPRVRASDAAFITTAQMEALLAMGTRNAKNVPLLLALLKGLEQIGDGRALPLLRELQSDFRPPVREQAEVCLSFVEARARRARESATLLRASSAETAVKSDQLLRPATAAPMETPQTQLLRPVE